MDGLCNERRICPDTFVGLEDGAYKSSQGFYQPYFFVILLRIPFSSLVSFASETSIIYSTTAPQRSSSRRQASSYFSRATIPCVSEFHLTILPAGPIAVLTELHMAWGGEGAGRWGGCSVVSNSNIGHLPLIL